MQEPILQSLASKYAKVHQRGKVLGTFIGGFIGGMLLDFTSLNTISYGIIILCIAWAIMIVSMNNPAKTKISYIHLDDTNQKKHKDLHQLKGCKEWYINDTENVVVIKYDEGETDEDTIREAIK